MDKQVLTVSLVCGFLGVFSVILGFTAEVTKINLSDLYVGDFECYHPSSPAFGCAIMATILLVIAQILVTAFGGCCGCCKRDPNLMPLVGTKRTLRIIFSIFSWITFGISVGLFILGADKNGTGGETTFGEVCYVVKPGVFAIAAIFALITLSLSITGYIILRPSVGDKQNAVPNNGIAMGHPQIPQNGQNQSPSPVNGGVQYMQQGNGGVQYMQPGNGGAQFPVSGNGGVQYPPPGTGGSQYTSTTEFTPPGKGST